MTVQLPLVLVGGRYPKSCLGHQQSQTATPKFKIYNIYTASAQL